MEHYKSREIPLSDYFHNLQLEWISYFVRSKIYEREVDVKMFNGICKMKKDKIDTFALRNVTSSIFTNKEKMKKYVCEFYNSGNIKFQYTPKNKKLIYWDNKFVKKQSDIKSLIFNSFVL